MAAIPNTDSPNADPNSDQADSLRSIVISVNPHSGLADRTELIEAIERKLTAAGFVVHVLSSLEEVRQRAVSVFEAGQLRAVVAAGGDGTVAMLANLLPFGIPLTILPLGTENLLAKYLELTTDVDSFIELMTHGQYRKIDAGRANGKLFLVMASCGFDANVVERLHQRRTGHISYGSWLRPIISSIRRYRYPELTMVASDASDASDTNDATETFSGRWVFVFNAPRYAMNLPLLPDADPHDGQLNMCSFRYGGLLRGAYYLAAVLLRKHRQWCETDFCKFRKMTITSDSRVPFQLDGDPGGQLPVTIEVLPDYVTMLVPETDEKK